MNGWMEEWNHEIIGPWMEHMTSDRLLDNGWIE